MSAYAALQFFELLLFAALLLYGALSRHPSITVLAGGLLVGKAALNILAPEGGSLLRRSVLGYGLGTLYVIAGVTAVKLLS